MLELAAGGLDGEALRQQIVPGVSIGHVLDVAGAAEAADLALQDDAHVRRGGGQEEAEDASSSAVSCSLRRSSISHARTDAATARTPITVSAPTIASSASTTPRKPGPESRSLMRPPSFGRECESCPQYRGPRPSGLLPVARRSRCRVEADPCPGRSSPGARPRCPAARSG